MNITAKSRYALKIMMDLADSRSAGRQQRHLIASRQGISVDFMDHIMAKLRGQKLIVSTRGRGGGFELGKDPAAISLWDIFWAVEDNIFPVKCMDESGCEFEDHCISYEAWNDVCQAIRLELSQRSLAEAVAKWQERRAKKERPDQHVFQECKAPQRHLLKSDNTEAENSELSILGKANFSWRKNLI